MDSKDRIKLIRLVEEFSKTEKGTFLREFDWKAIPFDTESGICNLESGVLGVYHAGKVSIGLVEVCDISLIASTYAHELFHAGQAHDMGLMRYLLKKSVMRWAIERPAKKIENAFEEWLDKRNESRRSVRSGYTIEEIKSIVNDIEEFNLEGKDVLNKFLLTDIMEIYNGAGPDSWPPVFRVLLTKAMGLFKPVIMIHDLDFYNSDGTLQTFLKVAERWKKNTRIVLDKKYPLWTWKMMLPSYRCKREYWWSVMCASNEAISGELAFDAYKASSNRKGNENE